MKTTNINSILRRDLAAFIQKTFAQLNPSATFLPNWHIVEIAKTLSKVADGKIKRLIINMPPRYLKSLCVNVAFPAWLLGSNPQLRILSASFNRTLAEKHSLDTRLLMSGDWYKNLFPACQLSAEHNLKSKFMTTQNGFRLATSIGAGVTGEGGNLLIIDDPMSPEMAASAAKRQRVNNWFDQTFSTRLDNKKDGAIILVMQRLHEDDLSGVLLRRGGWQHLCLPVMNEDGILLHPQREGWAELQEIRSTLGEYGFAAQYMQAPMRLENGMVRKVWLRYFSEAPAKFEHIVQSWDTAIAAHARADFSACLTFGIDKNLIYLVDVQRAQLDYPDLKRFVLQQSQKWQPDLVLIEDKASGQGLLQDLRRESKLPCKAVQPKQDKLTRLSAVSPLIETGRLVVDRRANWLRDFEAELLSFPHCKNDDQVDALSQFLTWFKSADAANFSLRKI